MSVLELRLIFDAAGANIQMGFERADWSYSKYLKPSRMETSDLSRGMDANSLVLLGVDLFRRVTRAL
jgi:hypothetical protein